MIEIGAIYNRKKSNCAHFVAQYFGVPSPDNELEFIRWMRKNFEPIKSHENGCLVVAGPPLHVGIYNDLCVKHMQNELDGGQLSIMELAIFRQLYKNIRYYKCLL